jgi:hypothetical protein
VKSSIRRAEQPAICPIHSKTFIRFGNAKEYSFGCPVCVMIIREQVRAERAGFLSLHRAGKRFRCVEDDTGSGRPG